MSKLALLHALSQGHKPEQITEPTMYTATNAPMPYVELIYNVKGIRSANRLYMDDFYDWLGEQLLLLRDIKPQ